MKPANRVDEAAASFIVVLMLCQDAKISSLVTEECGICSKAESERRGCT